MSWIKMIFSGPVNLIKFLLWREPAVTWEMLEHNRCDELQVKCMLQSTRAACDSCLDAYAYSMLQEQIRDLEERHACIIAERRRLNEKALQQGLTTDAPMVTQC
jgi:hypothetical protein